MARLIVIKGPDEGRQFDLPESQAVTIGRDRNNQITLHDTEVSRRHAELKLLGGSCTLKDLGSANGTFVNTRPVRDHVLAPGDHITIGQSILVFGGNRGDRPSGLTQLANQIRMVGPKTEERPSAIVKTVAEDEGSRILARPDQSGSLWLKTRLASLSVMYETTQAVSHILDLDQLLDRILELIFNSIPADHGCIMIRRGDEGKFEPKAIRFRRPGETAEKMTVSRTIMDWVLRERQGVLISDAARDDRFAGGNSITRFNIREVICVPMKGRHETHGVLFLDTTTKAHDIGRKGNGETPGQLTEEHLALSIAIAHQAALAVEETQYHQAMMSAERLAAVGQTIAALSHHIKNIMQGVVFGSEMVEHGLADDDKGMLMKGWRLVEKNQAKIHGLVMDMLSYSKDREPAIEMIEMNKLIADVIELIQPQADDIGARLEVRLSQSLPLVPADPDGLHKALLNIIGNAIDAVEGREDPYVGVQTLLEPGGEWVRIIVLDHGGGIEPDKINEIFKPFVSMKGARGTGLGLPVSRKILREHGGDVTVESKLNKGSKFILRLPMKSPLIAELGGTMQMPAFPPEAPEAN
ncbi:ATP-binding protein [Zavarzinella formosa]|uniref:ATP-binding protein n=1 Tax=Zavarzinella formosa TaxID=360055 RepID=UPI0002D5425A|nr:ATP-binding protein [Zavarzinella formosa]